MKLKAEFSAYGEWGRMISIKDNIDDLLQDMRNRGCEFSEHDANRARMWAAEKDGQEGEKFCISYCNDIVMGRDKMTEYTSF